MTTNQEANANLAQQISALGQRHFGHDLTRDEALTHIRTIMVILAADGISETEAWALRKAMTDVGTPKEVQDEAVTFDPMAVKLEDMLRSIPKNGRRAREIIRGAVRVASADGYSAREREKVIEAGHILGLDPKVVFALEALVDLETRVRELGDASLREPMVKMSHALMAAGG